MSTRNSLEELHKELCLSGITRRAKNLPISTTDVKTVVSSRTICAEIKHQFYRSGKATLAKATWLRRLWYDVWTSFLPCVVLQVFSFIQTTDLPSHRASRYLLQKGIAYSFCSVYHPSGNGQTETKVGTVWKAIRLALNDKRSLQCAVTVTTPHKRFFNFQRRSCPGESLLSWLTGTRTMYSLPETFCADQ